MTYLAGAYGVIWLLTFVFVGAILVQQRRVERRIEILEEVLAAREHRSEDQSF